MSLLPILLYHNLPAIPSLPCASLTRLAPHSGFPVPLYLSLPFLLSPALPSRALPRILVFQSHSTSPCHSFSPMHFPHAPCPAFWFSSPTLPLPAIPSLPCASLTRLAPAFWFSSPTLPLPAIPSLPCASLTRLAPHSGFPVPIYLSLPFRLSRALPSRALPRILVFQSHSTSPCHSFSPMRFPLAPCPAFWFSSPTLPLPAIPSLPCASLTRLAPHSGFPVPLYLSLPFLLSPALLSIIWPHSQSLLPTPQQDRLGIDDVVATLILSSDETIADGRGKAKGHPIYMSLGNIHHEDRWKPYGHALIATLPEFLAEYTSVDRLQIFQGTRVHDQSGLVFTAYPALYAYVADYPETCKLTFTKSLETNIAHLKNKMSSTRPSLHGNEGGLTRKPTALIM
ncbi:unnamed protein product [Closterium sp. NIES-65]|nr:unnamed protein product [Closterium sp. NIES-65]